MQAHPECHVCLLQQVLVATRMAGGDERARFTVLYRALDVLRNTDPSASPSAVAGVTNRIVREVTGIADPYQSMKVASTRDALALYPRLKELVAGADDPLEAAIRLSIAGNIIDVVHASPYDLEETVNQALEQPCVGDGLPALRTAMERTPHVLFLADNAGETVFDRVLIETLDRPVTYAVKSGPILNDATAEDAVAAGIGEVARVLPTGSESPGTLLAQCSDEFLSVYRSAELVIAKGQANYETLSDHDPRVFFLLKIKCPIIGQDADRPVGSIAVLHCTGQPGGAGP